MRPERSPEKIITMNVLVVAPHPDDETIGCGGTLWIHQKNGDTVSVIFLTSGELGLKHLPAKKAGAIREGEARKAARILKIKNLFFLRCSDWTLGDDIPKAVRRLRPLLKKLKPDLIYLPHPQDGHPDHQVAFPILQGALSKNGSPTPGLRFYEVWTPLSQYDLVQDITSCMDQKLRAIRAHESQLG